MQAARVGEHRCRGKLTGEGHPGGSETGRPVPGCRRGDLRQIACLHAELQSGGFRGGEGLQVLNHPAQPDRLFVQGGSLLRGVWPEAVEQRLRVGLQDRDRGAQLVGDVGDQVPPQLLLGSQSISHLVKGVGQFP